MQLRRHPRDAEQVDFDQDPLQVLRGANALHDRFVEPGRHRTGHVLELLRHFVRGRPGEIEGGGEADEGRQGDQRRGMLRGIIDEVQHDRIGFARVQARRAPQTLGIEERGVRRPRHHDRPDRRIIEPLDEDLAVAQHLDLSRLEAVDDLARCGNDIRPSMDSARTPAFRKSPARVVAWSTSTAKTSVGRPATRWRVRSTTS